MNDRLMHPFRFRSATKYVLAIAARNGGANRNSDGHHAHDWYCKHAHRVDISLESIYKSLGPIPRHRCLEYTQARDVVIICYKIVIQLFRRIAIPTPPLRVVIVHYTRMRNTDLLPDPLTTQPS